MDAGDTPVAERLRLLTITVAEMAALMMDMNMQMLNDAINATTQEERTNAFTNLSGRIREVSVQLERWLQETEAEPKPQT